MLDLSNVTDIMLGNETVTQIEDSLGNVLWSATPPTPTAEYFYIEDLSGSANTLSIVKSIFFAPDVEVFYSTDQQNWYSMGITSDTAITATIPANGKLYLKATADTWGSDGDMLAYNCINASGAHNVGGNIMSLLYSDNYTNQTTFPTGSAYNFFSLFSDVYNTGYLISAEDLILPATTLANYCYAYMFSGCTGLTSAPALPATTLANYCYESMFYGCTSLTTAPTLPATTLANSCYTQMFYGCTGLTTAPALSATTLATSCYSSMFYGCNHLVTPPVLPATTLAERCYYRMFFGCSSLTTAPTLPATTLAPYCYSGMFLYDSQITVAPALSATTLADYCYQEMFYATGIRSIILPATTLVQSCYSQMFTGCTSLTRIEIYANDNSANNCTSNWLGSVSATGDFYNLGSATYTADSTSGIPSGWTEHTSL